MQAVRDAMGEQRLDAGPAREDLAGARAARRGVAGVSGRDIAADLADDAREGAETEHAESVLPPNSGQTSPRFAGKSSAANAYGAKNGVET